MPPEADRLGIRAMPGQIGPGPRYSKITHFIQCVGIARQIGRQRGPALPPGTQPRLIVADDARRPAQPRVARSGQVPEPSGPSGGVGGENRACLGRAREKCKAGFTLRTSAERAGTLTTCFREFFRNRTEIC